MVSRMPVMAGPIDQRDWDQCILADKKRDPDWVIISKLAGRYPPGGLCQEKLVSPAYCYFSSSLPRKVS
jgi:hypothetical protein